MVYNMLIISSIFSFSCVIFELGGKYMKKWGRDGEVSQRHEKIFFGNYILFDPETYHVS